MILSIVKGSKRVRSTETILSKDGIIEMPKDSQDFCFFNKFEMSLIDLLLQVIGRKKISLSRNHLLIILKVLAQKEKEFNELF